MIPSGACARRVSKITYAYRGLPALAFALHGWQRTNEKITLEIGNIQSLPVEILDLTRGETVIATPKSMVRIPPKVRHQIVSHQEVVFLKNKVDIDPAQIQIPIEVRYRFPGSTKTLRTEVFAIPRASHTEHDVDLLKASSDLERFEFLKVTDHKKNVRFLAGNWSLSESLIIPEGYVVECVPGLTLDLENGVNFISYSPMHCEGTPEKPVRFRAAGDASGGVAVLNAQKQSVFRNVHFEKLGVANSSLSSAVTFYQSPVLFEDSEFINARSEDTLNLVRSEFRLHLIKIRSAFSDALDCDFSNGRITDSIFENGGNDAIDFSGCKVSMSSVQIRSFAEKGVSIGEASIVDIKNLSITNVKIGIATKDQSRARLRNSSIENAETGIVAFQKKPEYGPADINIEKLTIENTTAKYLREADSSIYLDGKLVGEVEDNLREIIYGDEA